MLVSFPVGVKCQFQFVTGYISVYCINWAAVTYAVYSFTDHTSINNQFKTK